jgi:hypothetical protein
LGNVLPGVVFHNVRAHDVAGDGVEMRDGFAGGHSSGFAVGNARRKRGVKYIHIEADVDRSGEFEMLHYREMVHLENLDAEALRLFSLVRNHGANTDLNQFLRQALFHDPRERTRVRKAAALEFVVEIGMRVEVHDREVRKLLAHRSQNWISDRVVSAQTNWLLAFSQDVADRRLDERKCAGIFGKAQVAGVEECTRFAQVDAGFAEGI